jgi:hypothetical protein
LALGRLSRPVLVLRAAASIIVRRAGLQHPIDRCPADLQRLRDFRSARLRNPQGVNSPGPLRVRPHQADAAGLQLTKITNSKEKKTPPGHALFEGPTVSLAPPAAVSGARSPPLPAKPRRRPAQAQHRRSDAWRALLRAARDRYRPRRPEGTRQHFGASWAPTIFVAKRPLFAPSPLSGPERWG